MRIRPLTTPNIDTYLDKNKYILYDFEETYISNKDLYTIQIHYDTSDKGFYLTVNSRGTILYKKYYQEFNKNEYNSVKQQF